MSTTPWPGASLYETTVRHSRTSPVVNVFTYRTYHWLVDLDRLPALQWPLRALARFDPHDHGTGGCVSLRADVDAFLAEQGVDLHGGHVTMLAHARVLGHIFNPVTIYWCHASAGALECVIAEVHNTYGGRHRYLLRPDAAGRVTTTKEFFVSPYNPVTGTYELSLPEPAADIGISIVWRPPSGAPFAASLHGRRREARPSTLLGLVARHPLAPLTGSARIRYQALKLYAARVPLVRRPVAGVHGSGNVRQHRSPRPARHGR